MTPLTRILAVLALLASTLSFAAPRAPAFLNVESIRARSEGRNAIVLDFKLQPRSLEWLRDNAVTAEWHIEGPDRRRFEVRSPIETVEGQVRFRVRGSDMRELLVRVRGRGPRHELVWMEIAGNRLSQVGVPVLDDGEPQSPPPPVVQPVPPPHVQPAPPMPVPTQNWAAVPGVISACGMTFDTPQNEVACLDAVRLYREDPTAAIRACDFAMNNDDAELDCVRAAARIRGDVKRLVSACDTATDSDPAALACVREGARARFDPADVIRACDFAMDADNLKLECMRVAMGAVQDPTPALKACERGMGGDAEELACFRRGIVR